MFRRTEQKPEKYKIQSSKPIIPAQINSRESILKKKKKRKCYSWALSHLIRNEKTEISRKKNRCGGSHRCGSEPAPLPWGYNWVTSSESTSTSANLYTQTGLMIFNLRTWRVWGLTLELLRKEEAEDVFPFINSEIII